MKTLRLLALLLCSLAPLLHAQSGLTRLGEFKPDETADGNDSGTFSHRSRTATVLPSHP